MSESTGRDKGQIFYDDGKATIQRVVETKPHNEGWTEDCGLSFEEFYDIQDIINCVSANNFSKIALQFPDELLGDSARISSTLSKITQKEVFILGDTSYGACCVDEVAAEHVNCDVVIHFGRACLSQTSRLPVFYVFGKSAVDTNDLFSHLQQNFDFNSPNTKIIIFYDLRYEHAMKNLKQLMDKHSIPSTSVVFTQVAPGLHLPFKSSQCSPSGCDHCGSSTSSVASQSDNNNNTYSHFLCGRGFTIPSQQSISDYKILYIGQDPITLNNVMMNYNTCQFWTYKPTTQVFQKETLNLNRNLMKRYYLVQEAKDASVIGILVATLAVARYLQVIDHLKRIIQNSGKKAYTFVVGKLNPAKLANFAEIDLFVIVACPENTIVDSKDFFKHIVTPFELEIALVRGKEWTGQYSTDFAKILPGMADDTDDNNNNPQDGTEEEEMRFSLISGTMKVNHKSNLFKSTTKESNKEDSGSSQEITIANGTRDLSVIAEYSPATAFLQTRSYQGLEPKIGETQVELAQEGTSGIPKGYQQEFKANTKT